MYSDQKGRIITQNGEIMSTILIETRASILLKGHFLKCQSLMTDHWSVVTNTFVCLVNTSSRSNNPDTHFFGQIWHLASGGFRGYAGYAAAYPIDWTGGIFVTFNFCPIVWNWIFGHRIIPCEPAWVQKPKHALITEAADTERSLQLVIDQDHGTLSGEQQCSPTSMYSVLCYQRWKCIRRSSKTVTTSSKPSLSCGSNAGMLQRNHPRLHWMHAQHAMHPCIQTYPSRCRFSALYPSTATPERSLSTLKRLDIPSVVNGRWAAEIIGAASRVHAQTTPIEPVEVVGKFALTGPHKLHFLR